MATNKDDDPWGWKRLQDPEQNRLRKYFSTNQASARVPVFVLSCVLVLLYWPRDYLAYAYAGPALITALLTYVLPWALYHLGVKQAGWWLRQDPDTPIREVVHALRRRFRKE